MESGGHTRSAASAVLTRSGPKSSPSVKPLFSLKSFMANSKGVFRSPVDYNSFPDMAGVLDEMRQNSVLTDGLITTDDGGRFPVHRAVMATVSPFFRTIFLPALENPPPGEPVCIFKQTMGPLSSAEKAVVEKASSQSGRSREIMEKLVRACRISKKPPSFERPLETIEVHVPDISGEVMGIICSYAYNGHFTVEFRMVEQTVCVSDHLHIMGLLKNCCQTLEKNLCPQNCLGVFLFSRHFHLPFLATTARRYILHNFQQMCSDPGLSSEWLQLDVSDVIGITGDDFLNVKHENSVFRAVMRWIEYDREKRVRHLELLLRSVRLGFFTSAALTRDVIKNDLVERLMMAEDKKDGKVTRYLADVQAFLAHLEESDDTEEPDMTLPYSTPRVPLEILFSVGGWSQGSPTNFIESYDTRADKWYLSMCTDRAPRAYHGTAYLNGKIYVVGGFDGTDYFNSVRCFNPITYDWTEAAPMYNQRCYVSCTTLNGKLYALGGYNSRVRLDTAERLDPDTNQWSLLPKMSRQRSDAAATSCQGKVYIFGGFDGHEVTSSGETYDPETNQWTRIRDMPMRRSGLNCATWRGHIYCMGGFNGTNRMQSVDRYSVISNDWSQAPDMFSPRSNFGVAVIDDMIFAIGGFNGTTAVQDGALSSHGRTRSIS